MAKIGVLGAGTWGCALARMLALNGHDTAIWSALPEEIDNMRETKTHPNLPGCVLPDSLQYTKEIKEICADRDILLFAVPSVFVRQTAVNAAPFIREAQIIVDVAKGIEKETLFTMTEVIADALKGACGPRNLHLVALSGPTHAEEVAKDMPTAIVSACASGDIACYVQDVFMNDMFRVYTSGDVHGVELCGALKNVIALASGMTSGLGYGDNARAALITRGMAEITRLGRAMDCHEQTFAGLAGIGDLIVTATSVHSRNNKCGTLIGKGLSAEEAIKEVGMVVEGINALPAAIALAEHYDIEMPIFFAVNDIVTNGADPHATVAELMRRERKGED